MRGRCILVSRGNQAKRALVRASWILHSPLLRRVNGYYKAVQVSASDISHSTGGRSVLSLSWKLIVEGTNPVVLLSLYAYL